MWKTVYDFAEQNTFSALFFNAGYLLVTIIFAALVTSIAVLIINRKKGKTNRLCQSICGILVVVFAFAIISLADSTKESKKLIDTYKSGDGIVITGEVKFFEPYENNGKYDAFTVDGVSFICTDAVNIGYNVLSSGGGAINENGQTVRICYVTDSGGSNYIMKLETKE